MVCHFRGRYFFLSNCYPISIKFQGVNYNSIEQAYQATKCAYDIDRYHIRKCALPKEARRLGKQMTVRPYWNLIKLKVMEDLLRLKFNHPHLRAKLKATANEEIAALNDNHNVFWGVCFCSKHRSHPGEDHLGRLLMKIRSEIIEADAANDATKI